MRMIVALFLLATSAPAGEPPAWTKEMFYGIYAWSRDEGEQYLKAHGIGRPPTTPGVYVKSAEEAGWLKDSNPLRPGSIIESVNGVRVATPDELRRELVASPHGSTVTLSAYEIHAGGVADTATVHKFTVMSRGDVAKSYVSLFGSKDRPEKSAFPNSRRLPPDQSVLFVRFVVDPNGAVHSPILIATTGVGIRGMQELTVRKGDEVRTIPMKNGKAPVTAEVLAVCRLIASGDYAVSLTHADHTVKYDHAPGVCVQRCMEAYEAYGGEWPKE